MAHNAEISALVEQLIKTTAKTSSKAQTEQFKRSALRTFAISESRRVNPFSINAQLEGLVEKASILNNEPLAEALQLRLVELSSRPGKWVPEILALFLNLSDAPAQRTKIENPILPELDPAPPNLTWSDIVADDPLDNRDGIWDNVDFAADGSDEDEIVEADRSDDFEHTLDSKIPDHENAEGELESLIQHHDDVAFCKIVNAQFWRQDMLARSTDGLSLNEDSHRQLKLTELQTAREVIFMLLGLPTSVFTLNDGGEVSIPSGIEIRHVSRSAIADLLRSFAKVGEKLRRVRSWNERRAAVPVEQTLQASIESRLGDVDRNLNEIQVKFVQPHTQLTPSLLRLYGGVCSITRLLQQVYDILVEVKHESGAELSFKILEHLFDKACANQSVGDEDGYEYMAKIFFECFQTYLRPVRVWMEMGIISKQGQVLFIGRNQEDAPLGSLWREQFHLIRNSNGSLHAPKFLHVAAQKIFNTGKSVVFMRHLGCKEDISSEQSISALDMTFETVCQSADISIVSPFAELFDMAFGAWLNDKHHSSSLTLRSKLESECGLQTVLDALEYIYFFRNGALSTNVAFKLFERINRGDNRWNDGLVLTELFQEAFSTIACFDLHSLEVRAIAATLDKGQPRMKRSMSALEGLHMIYAIPWPVANIIKTEAMDVYRRIFVFLLQIHRAKHLLQTQKLPRRTSPTINKYVLTIYSLHHRLLWFTDVILTYITEMVLSPSTLDMRINMRRAEDVDAMIAVHEAYIFQLHDRCFFTRQHGPIHEAIISILDLTILFSDMQASYLRQMSNPHGCSRTLNTARKAQCQDVDSDSDEDEGNDLVDDVGGNNASDSEFKNTDRLESVSDTFRKLHGYVLAAVQGIGKADSVPCWEMLGTSLAVSLKT